jgi:diguanylate cyclase (GGDEF)-like protein
MTTVDTVVIERVKKGMGLREISVIIILLLFLLYQYSGFGSLLPLSAYINFLIFGFIIIIINRILRYVILRKGENNVFKFISNTLDIIFLAYLIHLTGGIESLFALFYFLIVIGTSSFLGLRWGINSLIVSGITYSSVIYLEYSGAIPHYSQSFFKTAAENYKNSDTIIFIISFLFIVILLSTYSSRFIMFKLTAREKELEKTVRELNRANKALEISNDELLALNSRIELQNELLERSNNIQKILKNVTAIMLEHQSFDIVVKKLYDELKNNIPLVSLGLIIQKNDNDEPQIISVPGEFKNKLLEKSNEIIHKLAKQKSPLFFEEIYATPIKLETQVICLCYLLDTSSRLFRDDEIEMLNNIEQQLNIYFERLEFYEQLQHLSNTDGLTELYNHRYFHLRLEQEINRAIKNKKPLSLIIIDMDNFKTVNDMYGHQEGDNVLKYISGVIKEGVRSSDILARYGGDEFSAILPETDERMALNIAQRIIGKIKNAKITVSGERINLSACAGVASLRADEFVSSRELIMRVDNLLYSAKKKGHGNISTG